MDFGKLNGVLQDIEQLKKSHDLLEKVRNDLLGCDTEIADNKLVYHVPKEIAEEVLDYFTWTPFQEDENDVE